MLRRDVFYRYGYRDRGWPEDYDLVLRMLADGHRLGMVPRRLLHWRDHSRRLSRNDERYSIQRFTDCRAHFLAESFLASHQHYALWGYGGTGKALRKALAANGKDPAVIIELHPGRIGQLIFGAPVIAPPELVRYRDMPLLVSVAGAVARQQIRRKLRTMRFVETRDYVLCA